MAKLSNRQAYLNAFEKLGARERGSTKRYRSFLVGDYRYLVGKGGALRRTLTTIAESVKITDSPYAQALIDLGQPEQHVSGPIEAREFLRRAELHHRRKKSSTVLIEDQIAKAPRKIVTSKGHEIRDFGGIGINPRRPITELLGKNCQVVKHRLGQVHVMTPIREQLKAVRPVEMRKRVPVGLRRGWALFALQTILANRKLYVDVMQGRVG